MIQFWNTCTSRYCSEYLDGWSDDNSSLVSTNMFVLQLVRKLCPHHIGHHLGMDVHDVSSVGKNLPLSEGMVITIEPGLYVRNGMDVPRRWVLMSARMIARNNCVTNL